MNTTTKSELQQENDRLKAELGDLKKAHQAPFKSNTQLELTMHDVYLGARKKMTVGVVAVLSIVGLASGGSLYLEFLNLKVWMLSKLKTTMELQISKEILAKIELQKPKIDGIIEIKIATLKDTIDTKLDNANKSVDEKIELLKDKTDKFEKEFKKSTELIEKNLENLKSQTNSAVEKIKQTVIGAEQAAIESGAKADTLLRTNQASAIAKAQCDNQIAQGTNYSIKQLVIKTDKTYKDRPYYKNLFSVAAVGKENREFSTATTECFIDAVDRVVYTLNERWFNPNRIVRITPNDRYSFSTNVWGTTTIKAEIYLKDKSEPLRRCGRFLAKSVTPEEPEFFRSTNCS